MRATYSWPGPLLLRCATLYVDRMLDHYSWLGLQADRDGHLLFTAAPKLHWLWHFGQRSLFLSPRRSAFFIDEDFMKHMKTIAARCAAGTQLHMVPLSLMPKYRWGVMVEKRVEGGPL